MIILDFSPGLLQREKKSHFMQKLISPWVLVSERQYWANWRQTEITQTNIKMSLALRVGRKRTDVIYLFNTFICPIRNVMSKEIQFSLDNQITGLLCLCWCDGVSALYSVYSIFHWQCSRCFHPLYLHIFSLITWLFSLQLLQLLQKSNLFYVFVKSSR